METFGRNTTKAGLDKGWFAFATAESRPMVNVGLSGQLSVPPKPLSFSGISAYTPASA